MAGSLSMPRMAPMSTSRRSSSSQSGLLPATRVVGDDRCTDLGRLHHDPNLVSLSGQPLADFVDHVRGTTRYLQPPIRVALADRHRRD